MFFTHPDAEMHGGRFHIPAKANAVAGKALDSAIMKEFWHRFTFESSALSLNTADDFIFSLGEAKKVLPGEKDYAINVEETGIFLSAKDEKSLKEGFITLMDMFLPDGSGAYADCVTLKESPLIKNRMIHFCVFPDTELWEIKKFIRLSGALKYSHIVLEFWGMIHLDCLSELSWTHAFSKDEIRPLIKEANDLGMEVVPMFNHWGHASASRLMHGKHVVLDQNISLARLFDYDGWCWRIESDEVRALQDKIREELCELCGEGEYFHIGCDEAYGFTFKKEEIDSFTGFLNYTAGEIKKSGRTPIMWADMLLSRHEDYNKNNKYNMAAPTASAEKYILKNISRDIVMADWQYNATEAPIETALTLKNAGFTVLECPYDEGGARTSRAAVETVKNGELSGIMHTTWHTLSSSTGYIGRIADISWRECNDISWIMYNVKTADILRKAYRAKDYEKSGWARCEIGTRT